MQLFVLKKQKKTMQLFILFFEDNAVVYLTNNQSNYWFYMWFKYYYKHTENYTKYSNQENLRFTEDAFCLRRKLNWSILGIRNGW